MVNIRAHTRTKGKGLGRYTTPQNEIEGIYSKSGSKDSFIKKMIATNYAREFAEKYYDYRQRKYAENMPRTIIRWRDKQGNIHDTKVPITQIVQFKSNVIAQGGLIY